MTLDYESRFQQRRTKEPTIGTLGLLAGIVSAVAVVAEMIYRDLWRRAGRNEWLEKLPIVELAMAIAALLLGATTLWLTRRSSAGRNRACIAMVLGLIVIAMNWLMVRVSR